MVGSCTGDRVAADSIASDWDNDRDENLIGPVTQRYDFNFFLLD